MRGHLQYLDSEKWREMDEDGESNHYRVEERRGSGAGGASMFERLESLIYICSFSRFRSFVFFYWKYVFVCMQNS